jgi:DNA helicase-2/ATP-dependent DNA helicase PcrA
MYIGTIHAYCQRVLAEMDATYRQYDVLDENRLILYLMSRYGRLGLNGFRDRARNRSYFDTIKQVSGAWKTANDELLDFADIVAADADLGNLLTRINESLQTDQYIDFSLMIRNVAEAVRTNAAGIEKGIGDLRHLMVDEYQDVNPAQEELIKLLHARSGSLFVVGDDDQAIYAWRGADVSNIVNFPQRYPDCSTHTLVHNFRSTNPIVEASNSFAAAELGPSRIPKNPIAAANRTPQELRVLWFSDRDTEAEWVVGRIRDLLGTAYDDKGGIRGLTPADFAILMRSTKQVSYDGGPARHAEFTEALKRNNIPFSLEAGGGPFDRLQVSVLRGTFELLRSTPLNRDTVRQYFDSSIIHAYPDADFDALIRVLTEWNRKIHHPEGTTRIRLYPQQLVYELLDAFRITRSHFDDAVMRDIGLFSRMISDVETVYMSIDSGRRFEEILNFLGNAAETGYDVSTDDLIQRPDAVTVSTVHKMKGLEFPCVFVVDVEAGRFPKRNRHYEGWLPASVMAAAMARGAYQTTPSEEIRLFYTAITRSERYLYVSGAETLPNAKRSRKRSPFAQRLIAHPAIIQSADGLPGGLAETTPKRRVEETDLPTTFSQIKYYLQCPKGYQFRERYGFNPAIPELFGYGKAVHTAIQKLHELYPDAPPDSPAVERTVSRTFHLKHVPQSNDPVAHPGAYENSRNSVTKTVKNYVSEYGTDFQRGRQLEATFEIPAKDCVITGSIDLLLHTDIAGNITGAEVIDFKTMEGGEQPEENDDLDWTELSLQVQLYARAADRILGHNARTGSVHLLKDNQRVEIPITGEALDAAIKNVEWAVQGILDTDFPMRPHPDKCGKCDFNRICSKTREEFKSPEVVPPPLQIPPGQATLVRAFSQCEGQ